jgi:hypothetical protein
MTYLSDAWLDNPAADTVIEAEASRWKKLLANSFELTKDPLRYGPLTVDGYLEARRSFSISKERWPFETASIANLLIICQIEPGEVSNVAAEHIGYFDDKRDDMGVARTLLLQLELMRRLGAKPALQDLKDVLADVQWRDSYVDAYTTVFKLVSEYLHSADDETSFLSGWLPSVPGFHVNFESHSLSVEVARYFPRADPAPLVSWCKKHCDEQGIAYLVLQERVPFREWLREVASPTNPSARMHYDDMRDYERNWGMERLSSLEALIDRAPIDELQSEYSALLAKSPKLTGRLIDMVMGNPYSEYGISWIAALVKAGGIPADQPDLKKWFNAALAEQAREALQCRDPGATRRSERVNYASYAKWASAFSPLGAEWRDFVAEHLVHHLHLRADVRFTTTGDTAWLNGTNMAKSLITVADADGVMVNNKMITLLPFLSPSDKATIGTRIVMAVVAGKMTLTSILVRWSEIDTEYFVKRKINTRDDGLTLLSAISQQDTAGLASTLNALDVDSKSPAYEPAIQSWLQKALGVEVNFQYAQLPDMLTGTI